MVSYTSIYTTGPQWVNKNIHDHYEQQISGTILGMDSTNDSRRYNVSSLIGWAHTQNDSWDIMVYFATKPSAMTKLSSEE